MDGDLKQVNKKLTRIEKILVDIKDKSENSQKIDENEEFLTVAEAAGFLKLSIKTMYGLIHGKKIPYIKSRKRCYFFKRDLKSYLGIGANSNNSEQLK